MGKTRVLASQSSAGTRRRARLGLQPRRRSARKRAQGPKQTRKARRPAFQQRHIRFSFRRFLFGFVCSRWTSASAFLQLQQRGSDSWEGPEELQPGGGGGRPCTTFAAPLPGLAPRARRPSARSPRLPAGLHLGAAWRERLARARAAASSAQPLESRSRCWWARVPRWWVPEKHRRDGAEGKANSVRGDEKRAKGRALRSGRGKPDRDVREQSLPGGPPGSHHLLPARPARSAGMPDAAPGPGENVPGRGSAGSPWSAVWSPVWSR